MRKKFTDCVDIVGSSCENFEGTKFYISTGAVDEDNINEYGIEVINFEEKPSRANLVVKSDDIIFAKMQATKKTLLINEEFAEYVYSTGFCAVHAKKNILTRDCLLYLLMSEPFLNQKDKNCSGATQKAITNAGLQKIIINIPDYKLQDDISKRLSILLKVINMRKNELDMLEDLIKARFVELFGDLANPECIWDKCQFIDACVDNDDIKCGPFGTQLSKDEYTESGVAVWEIPQINKAFLSTPTHFLAEEKAEQLKAYTIVPGDIAMSRKGNVGKCALFPESYSDGIIHSDVLRIRVDKKRVNPVFMMCQLHFSGAVTRQIELISSGAIMAGVNVTKLKQIFVHIPPMELQNKFAHFVNQVDKSKVVYMYILKTRKYLMYNSKYREKVNNI